MTTTAIERPEGISDVRWTTIQSVAHLMATGHAPWCDDHQGGPGHDEGDWCQHTVRTFCARVVVHNSGADGLPEIVLYVHGNDNPPLKPTEALAVGSVLEMAVNAVKLGNVSGGVE